jgi:hypothetical protein
VKLSDLVGCHGKCHGPLKQLVNDQTSLESPPPSSRCVSLRYVILGLSVVLPHDEKTKTLTLLGGFVFMPMMSTMCTRALTLLRYQESLQHPVCGSENADLMFAVQYHANFNSVFYVL